jgi:hypothetical protein
VHLEGICCGHQIDIGYGCTGPLGRLIAELSSDPAASEHVAAHFGGSLNVCKCLTDMPSLKNVSARWRKV